jgi:hypothetical protein
MPIGANFTLGKPDHRFLGAAFDLGQGDAEQNREEDDLKYLVVCCRFEEALRHEVLEDAAEGGGLLGELAPGFRGAAQAHTHAGLHQVHSGETDEERETGYDLEVDDRLQCESSHPLHVVAVAGNSDDQAAEDDGDDYGFDHPQEDRGQRLEARAEVGVEPPDQCTQHHEDQNPLRVGDSAEESPDAGHREARAPVLASIPATTEAYDAANFVTPSSSS